MAFWDDWEFQIEHLPAKVVLFGVAMIAMWVLPASLGVELGTQYISETQMLVYKIILSVGLAIITHFVVDRIAD